LDHHLSDHGHKFACRQNELNLTIHLECLNLISCLIHNYEMGIMQAKKIISYEYLKQILTTTWKIGQLPYRVKIVYLRSIFAIFVTG